MERAGSIVAATGRMWCDAFLPMVAIGFGVGSVLGATYGWLRVRHNETGSSAAVDSVLCTMVDGACWGLMLPFAVAAAVPCSAGLALAVVCDRVCK
jgi:hypothetical protein